MSAGGGKALEPVCNQMKEAVQREMKMTLVSSKSSHHSREPHRKRVDSLFPRYALIRGMGGTSNADWWYARVTGQLTSLIR